MMVMMMWRSGFLPSRESLYLQLQECMQKRDVMGGREVLCFMVLVGMDLSVPVFSDHLIRLFASRGSLDEADHVFSRHPRPTVITWNSIILAHLRCSSEQRALQLYQELMQAQHHLHPDVVTFLAILQACGALELLDQGRAVHHQIVSSNLELDSKLANTLADMYAKCGRLPEAYRVFVKLCHPNVVSWTIIISSFARSCDAPDSEFALRLHGTMLLHKGIKPNNATFMATLKVCINSGYVHEGKVIHAHIVECGCNIDEELGGVILDMYSKCGCLEDAHHLFARLPTKDLVAWGTIICGYAAGTDGFRALEMYESMQGQGFEPDKSIYASVLKACARLKSAPLGLLIHDQVVKEGFHLDLVVGTALVDMYSQCANLECARNVFNHLPKANEVSWGVLIKGYVQCGDEESAFHLYEKMREKRIHPNKATYLCLLQGCCNMGVLIQGMLIHDRIVRDELESECAIGSHLVGLYAQSGHFIEAHSVSDKLPKRDKMAWGALFDGYMRNGRESSIYQLFEDMESKGERSDGFIFICVLKACGAIRNLRVIHHKIVKEGLEEAVGSILIDSYAKHGSLSESLNIFGSLSDADVAAWTALIGGYASNLPSHALHMFEEMKQANMEANKLTFVCVLRACCNLRAIRRGRLAHDEIVRSGSECEGVVAVANALMDMYTACGRIEDAQRIFENLKDKDVVSWTTMLVARSRHGCDLLALELFERMQAEGLNLSNACFLCVMRSCANIGAMLRGKLVHFSLLLQSHESDTAVSIGALIDMYAKCGYAEEARKLFDRWQHRREIASWGSLVSGYARIGRIGPARRCFIGMQSSGIAPNRMVFASMMTACCHEGLMEEGLGYFRSMQGEHGIDPSLEHYGCLIDLLGRLGALDEACDLPGSMPMPPDLVVWRALLHACKLHDDEALGSYCFGNRLAPSSLYKLASSDCEGLSSGEVTGPRVYECPSKLSEDEPLYVPFFGCEYSPSFSEDLLER